MLDLSKLINWKYVSTDPGSAFVYQWYIIGFLFVCLLIAIILIIVRMSKKKKLSALSIRTNKLFMSWLLYPSIVGLFLVFISNKEIATLSWRIWSEALAIVWLSGIIYILYFLILVYPQESKKSQLLKSKEKYLP